MSSSTTLVDKLGRLLLISFVIWFIWPFLTAAYNYLTLDSRIIVLPTKEVEIIAYDELLKQEELRGRSSVLLFHNGWTKDLIEELDHQGIFDASRIKGFNLIYLSNEFGDAEYNRSRVDWFNNISKEKLLGFNIYDPNRFELYEQYILRGVSDDGKDSWSFPLGIRFDELGSAVDTIYGGELNVLEGLFDQKKLTRE